MIKILVDTDVLINYSKGYSKDLDELFLKQENGEVNLVVNSVVVAEFFTNDKLKIKTNVEKALEFIGLFEVVEIGKKDGILAGRLMGEKKVNYLGDALIAANCINGRFKLATKNKKHFRAVKGLKFN